MTHQGAARDAASVHFRPSIRRTYIVVSDESTCYSAVVVCHVDRTAGTNSGTFHGGGGRTDEKHATSRRHNCPGKCLL